MAVVFNPLLSQEAHGKVGGTEFRLIRGRSVVGRVSLATPQRTLNTNDARRGFDHAVKGWRNISDADRALWAQASGSPELGFQLWTQRACTTYACDGSLPSVQNDPAQSPSAELTFLYSFDDVPPAVSIEWNCEDPGGAKILFYWQPKQRTSPNPSPWRWLLLGSVPAEDEGAGFDTPQYSELFHIRGRIISVLSGQVYQEIFKSKLL